MTLQFIVACCGMQLVLQNKLSPWKKYPGCLCTAKMKTRNGICVQQRSAYSVTSLAATLHFNLH